MKLKANLLKLGLLAITLAVTGTALAQETKTDAGSTGKVAAAKASDESARVELFDFNDNAEAALSSAPGAATFGSLTLTVQVDHTYCGTGGVQCTGPGLSTVAAANNNRNPVRLGIQVLNGTTPVNTLTDADINIVNSFVPAGGTALVQLACATCFQNAGNGTYAIFIHPANNALWKSGSYFVQVQVKIGARTHRALAQIEIPF